MDLATFNKIIEELEATQHDLKVLLEIQSETEIKVAQLTLKALANPKFQPDAESAFLNLQEIDFLIGECQNSIALYSKALSSPNPN